MKQLLMHIFYGLVSGISQFSPMSASAHQALFPMLLRFESGWPMLRFFVHAGALAALFFMYCQRLTRIFRQIQIVVRPDGNRKQPLDKDAVLDVSLCMMAVIPMLIGAIISAIFFRNSTNLLWMGIALILGAVLIYLPDYLPGGDRKTGALTRAEGLLFGVCAALSVLPGISTIGLMLAIALLLKCDRQYILDLLMLICGIMLAEMMLVDLISFFVTGFAGLTLLRIVCCIFACASACGGGCGAIMLMRHLAVKTSFSGFAFYGWGLGLFSLILYLMV